MKWLGVDIELNLRGIWNIGLALFQDRKTLDQWNIFIEEFHTDDPSAYDFGGDGASINKYRKSREYLNGRRAPLWVSTLADADRLAHTLVKQWGFQRSFGYNSNQFDLQKLEGDCPRLLSLLLAKPHLDLMPLVVFHLVKRKSYMAYWEKHVELGNTSPGKNAAYAKFNAELALNYICDIQYKRAGKVWVWKKEKHVGVEDLVEFEYPILHYFKRVLKAKTPENVKCSFVKWDDRISRLPLGEKEE